MTYTFNAMNNEINYQIKLWEINNPEFEDEEVFEEDEYEEEDEW